MKTSRLILILALLFSATLLSAQTSPQKPLSQTAPIKRKPATKQQKPPKEEPGKQWLERAEYLTQEAREEEWRLHEQRPLLLARLAEAWWKYDIKKARPWMDSAVGELEIQPQNESVSEGVKRLHIAETVLGIVVPLDRTYADRLLKAVTQGAERLAGNVMSEEDRHEFGRLKIDLPRVADAAVREKNLDSADRIFRTLIKLKDGLRATETLLRIRSVDAGYADTLYASALESTRTTYDPALISALGEVAFPMMERSAERLPSEALRERYLDLFAEAVLRLPQGDEDQKEICKISRAGDRLIDKYPPEHMAAMRLVLDDCKRRQPTFKESRNPQKKLETMDDFLKAAEDEPDADRRANYKSWAAIKANGDGQVLRALEIIRSLTEEEREAFPAWANDYMNYETDAIEVLYKRHDLPALQRLMDDSPRRPRTLLMVSNMLFAAKDESFALSILSEARRALEKTQLDEPMTYWSFLGTYVKYVPSESAAVLKEVVLGLNGIKKPVYGPNVNYKFWWMQFSEDLRFWTMRPELLDLDPQYVSQTIKLMDSVENRTTFRISLLRTTLQRYERDKAEEREKQQSAPAKINGRDNVAPANHKPPATNHCY